MKYFHVCTHCNRKWRKIETIYDLPDSANLSFFSESTQVHGIGNAFVLTLFMNSQDSISCLGKFVFYHHIVVLAAFLSCTFANGLHTNRKGVVNGEFKCHVIVVSVRFHFFQLSIEVFLLEEFSFNSSLRDSVSSKSCEKQNKTTLPENAEYLGLYN